RGPSGPSAIFSLPKNFMPLWQCRATTPGSSPVSPAGRSSHACVGAPNPTSQVSSTPSTPPACQVRPVVVVTGCHGGGFSTSRSRSRTAAPSSPLGSTGPADRSSGSRPGTARRSARSGVVGDVVTGIAPSSGGSEAERPQPSQQLVLPPGCVLGAPRTERTGARL